MRGGIKSKGNREIRIGPINQAKESQSWPPKGRWEVEGGPGGGEF